MRLHTTGTMYARSKYPTQLAKLSFDEILDLTADVFSFCNMYLVEYVTRNKATHHTPWHESPMSELDHTAHTVHTDHTVTQIVQITQIIQIIEIIQIIQIIQVIRTDPTITHPTTLQSRFSPKARGGHRDTQPVHKPSRFFHKRRIARCFFFFFTLLTDHDLDHESSHGRGCTFWLKCF